jgi:aminoglycoside phosphotransferase (APT) family kinase protein
VACEGVTIEHPPLPDRPAGRFFSPGADHDALAALLQPAQAPGGDVLCLAAARAPAQAAWSELLAQYIAAGPADRTRVVVVPNALRCLLDRLRGRSGWFGPRRRTVAAALRRQGRTVARIYAASVADERLVELRRLTFGERWRAETLALCASSRPGSAPSRVERVLAEASPLERLELERLVWSGKDKALLFARANGVRRIVIRLPLGPAAAAAEAKAFAVLSRLDERGDLRGRVPAPVGAGEAAGVAYFAETAIEGDALATVFRPDRRTAWLPGVEAFLVALNPPRSDPSRRFCDWRGFAVDPVLQAVLRHIDNPQLRARLQAAIEQATAPLACRLGIAHGDLSARNILVRGGAVRGVIDWEDVETQLPPLLDAMNYVDSVHRRCARGDKLRDTVPRLARSTWPVPEEEAFLSRAFERCAASPEHRPGYAWLFWLRHVGTQLAFAPERRLDDDAQALLQRMPTVG